MLYIFDWDGTLSDSAAKITDCMTLAAEELVLKARSPDDIRNIIGLGLPEAIRTLYPDIDEASLQRYRTAYSKHFIERDKTPSPFFPA